MKKYEARIEVRLVRYIGIEANDEYEARTIAYNMIGTPECTLDDNDWADTIVEVEENE